MIIQQLGVQMNDMEWVYIWETTIMLSFVSFTKISVDMAKLVTKTIMLEISQLHSIWLYGNHAEFGREPNVSVTTFSSFKQVIYWANLSPLLAHSNQSLIESIEWDLKI